MQTIQLTLNFKSIAELHKFINQFLPPATPEKTEPQADAKPSSSKKRGRPPKTTEQKNGDTETPAVQRNDLDSGPLDYQELKKICADGIEKHGRDYIVRALSDFQVERLSELDTGQYADFAEYVKSGKPDQR